MPVIAYDRFISGAPVDYYVSFDNEKVGQLQAPDLVDLMKKAGKTSGKILMINGSPTDNNAGQFKKGAHSVLDNSGYTVAAEYDTPDWSPTRRRQWMEGQISPRQEQPHRRLRRQRRHRRRRHRGPQGRRRRAAPAGHRPGRRARRDPAHPRRRPGDDGLQGDQARGRGRRRGRHRPGVTGRSPTPRRTYQGVPSTLLVPVAVTKDNIKDTVVKDGVYKVSDICTGDSPRPAPPPALS